MVLHANVQLLIPVALGQPERVDYEFDSRASGMDDVEEEHFVQNNHEEMWCGSVSTYGETMIHTSPTTVPSVTCRSQQPATGKLNPVPYSAPGWYQFEPLCLARKKGRTRSP